MPVSPENNPLNQGHCDCLNRVLESVPHTEELLDCMERCGIDVADLRRQVQSNKDRASKLKAEFFSDAT